LKYTGAPQGRVWESPF